VLGCNVFTQIHQPIDNEIDHFTIIEDIYHEDHGFEHPYCTNVDNNCKLNCKAGKKRNVKMSMRETEDKLKCLAREFTDTYPKGLPVETVHAHYKKWKATILELFYAPISQSVKQTTKGISPLRCTSASASASALLVL
ncbi:hypothetical protein PENTCL1PPCAC_952, partial [Pristionchus entomophagus]